MADACPGTSMAKLSWLVAWYIRDETYQKGLAELVNYQHRLPFAAYWGEGNTSSSDGQRFRARGHGQAAGYRNAKYGSEPGVLFYTHISDQYAPFHTKVINSPVRDATHVLDGLLYHESELRIGSCESSAGTRPRSLLNCAARLARSSASSGVRLVRLADIAAATCFRLSSLMVLARMA